MGQRVIVVVGSNNYRLLLALNIFILAIFGVQEKQKVEKKIEYLLQQLLLFFSLQFVE